MSSSILYRNEHNIIIIALVSSESYMEHIYFAVRQRHFIGKKHNCILRFQIQRVGSILYVNEHYIFIIALKSSES